MEIVAARTFNTLYIYLDIIWLLAYTAILIYNKRYLAIIMGVFGGLLYFAVDYGIFYLALNTRIIIGADPFGFLLWLSMSYGFTNFAWIWLLLDKDGKAVEWSTLTIAGWLSVALLSQNFGSSFPIVSIQRGTASYHGIMALILLAGYGYLILKNLKSTSSEKVNILRLLAIGIGVQFSWEFILLISNIRPAGVLPLIVNSLIETNLGMPYLYLIHQAVTKRVKWL
ncbi:MAG: hypothetical protein PHY03_03955 [Dehalococcoidia bacterium]|nr:hypothetical protein [Dehalococcoidia bacterium]